MSQRPEQPSASTHHAKPIAGLPGTNPLGSSFPTESAAAHVLGEMKAEVSPEATPLWNFALNHAGSIAAGVIGLVVLIVAVGGYQWYAERAEATAHQELGKIISMQNAEARLKALEAFLPSATGSVRLGTLMETATAAVAVGDWDRASAAYAQVIALEKDSPLGMVARFSRADVLMKAGKPAEAYTILEVMLQSAPETMRPALNEQLALAAEEAGMTDKALAAYDALIAGLPVQDTETRHFYTQRKQLVSVQNSVQPSATAQ